MSEPTGIIDLGHSSSPTAVATPWERTQQFLESAEVFWLSTVRADGRPHATPISALWLDGVMYFQAGDVTQKSKHMRGNPYVTLTTGCNHFEPGFDVVVEGVAAPFADVAVLEHLNQMWRKVWGENWPIEFRDGAFYEIGGSRKGELLTVYAVKPTSIFAYERGDQWSQTRYAF